MQHLLALLGTPQLLTSALPKPVLLFLWHFLWLLACLDLMLLLLLLRRWKVNMSLCDTFSFVLLQRPLTSFWQDVSLLTLCHAKFC